MAISQQKFRGIVFQLIFSQSFASFERETINFVMHTLKVTRKVLKQAEEKSLCIQEKCSEIDALIESHSDSYAFTRITQVEKAVLRLAIYELLYVEELPPKVVISEAIRLTRKFATVESAGFVNAVIDTLYKKRTLNVDTVANETPVPSVI